MGVLRANHGGQTCVAAPLSIMMSTLFSSCWTDCSVDAIGVDDTVLSTAATRCIAGACCSCAAVGCSAVCASFDGLLNQIFSPHTVLKTLLTMGCTIYALQLVSAMVFK